MSRGYGKVPDEAILLARRLPNVRVCIGKNRLELAQSIRDVDLMILDDGFQHRKLFRDFEIVLASKEKEHYLPWGFLRDSPKRLKKADALFFLREDYKLRVKRILDQQGKEISSIRGWKVAIFCGIANPNRFKNSVIELGAEVVAELFLADHEVADLSKLPKERALLCTEKDFVKLPPNQLPIYYLEMELELTSGREKWEKLIEKIDQKIDNRCTYE